MLGYAPKIFVLVILKITIVKCMVPVTTDKLSVRYVDNKLIERKRQDTREMCQFFEKERLRQSNVKARRKREIPAPKFGGVPTMREQDIKRVESIVDKLYDDLTENGQPVRYRHRVATTAKAEAKREKLNEKLFNRTSRRFDFAPAVLLGPNDREGGFEIPETTPVEDWIKKWKHGIIPYYIDSRTYDSGLADVITSAFDYFERATCIRLQRLREKPADQQSMERVEWVYITNPMGIRQCVHSNERLPNKGVQMVVFGYDCLSLGEIVHEVMHILGFSHEHTRPDRDQHVSIMWDNIKPGYKKYFELRKEDSLLRLPYDYASVLHYPPRAFSKNGKITVSAKAAVKLGQREGLSETDVEKVALIFGNECVDRNKDYLLTTCPSVVKPRAEAPEVTKDQIEAYFKNRIWPLGVVSYKIINEFEFTAEEKENIQSVIRHIEKETCIVFRDINEQKDDEEDDGKNDEGDYKDDKTVNNKEEPVHPMKVHKLTHTVAGDEANEIDSNKLGDEAIVSKEVSNKLGDEAIVSKEVSNKLGDEAIVSKEENANAKNNVDQEDVTVGEEKDEVKTNDDKTETKASDAETDTKIETSEINTEGNTDPAAKDGKRSMRGAAAFRSSRRHTGAVLELKRSTEPGCKCPTPGKPKEGLVVQLNADCFNSVNDLLHYFVHILGLDHQHNMHDRDDFLHIVWDKLTPEVQKEMKEKLPPEASAGFSYDYQSVMHYPWLQIKDGVTSIMYPIWNDGWAMGHWQGLSYTDVQKLNTLYLEQCLERKKIEDEDNEESKN